MRPGDVIRFMVSTEGSSYRADIVRLIHGDERPEGPGFKEDSVAAVGRRPGRIQRAHAGAYLYIRRLPAVPDEAGGFRVSAWISPNVTQAGHLQTAFGRADGTWSLGVEPEGDVALRLGGTVEARTGTPLRPGEWTFITAAVDGETGSVSVTARSVDPWSPREVDSGPVVVDIARTRDTSGPILIGAGRLVDPAAPEKGAEDLFNGKIEAPTIVAGALSIPDHVHASWRLGPDCSTLVPDIGPHGADGIPVNLPVRGVTSHTWDGSVNDYRFAPDQYAALEFHENSLEDARWDPDIELTIPREWRSGVYALRLETDDEKDWIPFFVRPGADDSRAKVAVLLPTLTYLCYANERLQWGVPDELLSPGRKIETHPLDELVERHPEWGISTYDMHPGGAGCSLASWLRPIPNMRPHYRMWLTGAGRNLGGDLYLIDWLEHENVVFDVITDEDLHHEGIDLLKPYAVVISGAHPEYSSMQMLDAIEGYLGAGGRFMYLGGNGFLWVTTIDPDRPNVCEMRRPHSGILWEARPGELTLATTGEPGGVWKDRGRSAHRIFGVGFCAQGWDDTGPGFVRLPDGKDPRAEFVFDGVGEDEVIGGFGLVMGGAVGDEVDRADPAQGTPPHTLILARSQPLSRFYEGVLDESKWNGENNPELIRADMTLFDTAGGGAVFSVGSIAWSGALSYKGYDNNVAKVTRNVIDRFLDPAPLGIVREDG